ncbi:PD-(D/E)XK nuclease family protein [Caviibacter abscessus]|uniref:hypothetical protein n=1 Tax=Caviibacter abscessus TaxID=1766719 RepID=UPI00082BA9E5|nr:hypothetical protein [Caviibacter abscessus]
MNITFKYFDISNPIQKSTEENILYLKNNSDFNDFFENVTLTDKIILKEEKEVMFFFTCLDDNQKKFFGINKYFDCIDLAYNYYRLIADLYENNISLADIKYEKWQKSHLENVYNIHNKMIDKVHEGIFVPRYLKYHKYEINNLYLKKYKKIIFINKMYTSMKEKEILSKINIPIEYHIYSNKDDFSEKKLMLTSFTLKYDNNKNIKAYNFTNEKTMLLAFTQYLSENTEKEIVINDICDDKSIYREINRNLFDYGTLETFEITKSYKILNHLEKILRTTNNKNSLLVNIYNSILDNDFVKFFNINLKQIDIIKNMVNMSKKYIENEYIQNILESTYNLENLYSKLAKTYIDEADIFLEAVTEILSTDEFFPNIINENADKIKLLLKYLDAKKIKQKLKSSVFKISKNISDAYVNELILLNIHSFASKKQTNYILNNNQRKELGLLVENDLKYVTYYDYIRQIYLADNVKLYYILNQEEEIDASSIFQNLFYIFNIVPISKNYGAKYMVTGSKFVYNPNIIDKSPNFLTYTDVLPKKEDDLYNLSLNGYSFYNFYEFPIVYMLNILTKKFSNIDYKDVSIDARFIGNIIHKLFETCINNKFYTYEEIKIEKNKLLLSHKEYIKREYYEIYDFLIFDSIIDEVYYFMNYYKDYNIESEKKIELEYKGIKIKYIMDAFLEKDNNKIILDFKTGSSNEEQEYQLSGYKIFTENQLNISIDKLILFYLFDTKKITEVKSKFDLIEFDNAILNFKNLKYYEVAKKIKDYNLKNVIRGDDYES